ncbi:hypothetical protein MesoLj113a_18380 [Mesorhizobium sp. 113-1-2]|nr:Uncharacterized protein MLTONO_2583 [Mesorhizobium loti]BCG70680.1 hypothetical protein MesoLj113a_18380 [Mesorhizobium sp. 113-1-2]
MEAFLTQRRIDRERIERADREAKLAIEDERAARIAKTERLRAQRLLAEPPVANPAPAKCRRAAWKKPARKIIEVE